MWKFCLYVKKVMYNYLLWSRYSMTTELNQIWSNIQKDNSSKALIFLAANNLMKELDAIENASQKLGGLEEWILNKKKFSNT